MSGAKDVGHDRSPVHAMEGFGTLNCSGNAFCACIDYGFVHNTRDGIRWGHRYPTLSPAV